MTVTGLRQRTLVQILGRVTVAACSMLRRDVCVSIHSYRLMTTRSVCASLVTLYMSDMAAVAANVSSVSRLLHVFFKSVVLSSN